MPLEGYNDYGTSGTFSCVIGISDIRLNQLGFCHFQTFKAPLFRLVFPLVVGMNAMLCQYLCEAGKKWGGGKHAEIHG